MNSFDRWLEFLSPHEGGWSNDPDDRGGRTRYGISSKANPDVDLDALTPESLRVLIRERYWNAVSGDRVADLSAELAITLADYGFNSGPEVAVQDLQRIVDTEPDGDLGPITLAAVERDIGSFGSWYLVRTLNDRRRLHLRRAAKLPGQAKYLDGWLDRVDDLEEMLA